MPFGSQPRRFTGPTGLSDPESLIAEIVANHKNVIKKKEGENRSDDVMVLVQTFICKLFCVRAANQ